MTNLDALEKRLQNNEYGNSFAFNDLIGSLTKGSANDILFLRYALVCLSDGCLCAMEVFAGVICIDMRGSTFREDFKGLLKDLSGVYKEVVTWKV